FQLDVAQRADRLHAPCGEQRRGYRPQTTDGVRAGGFRRTEHEHADAACVTHADAGVHAHHLPLDARFELRLRAREGLSANADRTELRNVYPTVAADDEPGVEVLGTVQLQLEHITGADGVSRRHRDVGRRSERRDRVVEQVVTERLQGCRATLYKRQFGH